ncbi:MAG: DNA polymerase III subunit delta, partial [Syntrophomonadaceae bacterium]|nr:DNA polymerase III subunit delta [Syntrophomonadaceae bacterium]
MAKQNIYYIWGEESFLIDAQINKITSQLREQSGEEPELTYVDADELSPLEILEILEFNSLFALQRILIFKRPLWLGKAKRSAAKVNDIEKIIRDYLQRDHEGQVLVFTADEHNTSNVLVKLLDKEATVITCKTASSQFLTSWINDEFNMRKRSVRPATVNMLARSGQDMYYLQNLIDKLCLTEDSKVINEADVKEELDNKEEIKIFKLTDALLARNTKASFAAYSQLLSQGEHPVFFLYMIVRQFIALGKVKYYQEKGSNKLEIAQKTGLKEFSVRKMTEYARHFSWEEIRELFGKFLQAD